MAEADTIVFDKTGTLTKANPTVVDVVSFNGQDSDELLRIAACLEEHFPHSMAKAVVDAAAEKNLEHEEVHSEVEYIVAHGISSMIDGQKVVIGVIILYLKMKNVQLILRRWILLTVYHLNILICIWLLITDLQQ